MFKDKRLGLALIFIGVLANNFVYLVDLFDEALQPGMIYLGSRAIAGVVVSVVVIAIGVIILWRSQTRGATE